jgi:hypothetical protein
MGLTVHARAAPSRAPARRAGLLAAGGVALLLGMGVGLRRAGWELPLPSGLEPGDHAALMVSGFLGTLISLERAVALRLSWSFAAPAASALGTLALLTGLPRLLAAGLFATAGGVLGLVYGHVVRLQPAPFTATLAGAAGAWLLGTLAWAAALPVATWVTAWAAFLVLTIVAERLELSRLARLPRVAWSAFAAAAALHGGAVVLSFLNPSLGVRLSGLSFAGWALWLVRFDVAWRTVRVPGLPRFAAAALLLGYGWLLVAAVLWLTSPGLPAGLRYDAEVHALFLGFVFSMVFAHAPIIWPSVLGGELRFHPRFYAHLVLLHLSVLLRVAADLAGSAPARRWAVALNTLSVLLFLLNTAAARRGRP